MSKPFPPARADANRNTPVPHEKVEHLISMIGHMNVECRNIYSELWTLRSRMTALDRKISTIIDEQQQVKKTISEIWTHNNSLREDLQKWNKTNNVLFVVCSTQILIACLAFCTVQGYFLGGR